VNIINRKCEPTQRVTDVVEFCSDVDLGIGPHGYGFELAVVTNCSRPTTTLILDRIGLLHKFPLLITNTDVDGNIKPHPQPYKMALRHYGIVGNDAIAIDDNVRGIKSAEAAGCCVWALKNFEDLTIDNLYRKLRGCNA